MSVLPNRDRQAERREATRREIVEAAWEIARAEGLSSVTLREVAARVGMRSPSLYTHFASKNAIYDAMFGEAWSEFLQVTLERTASLPKAPRVALLAMSETFFDFAVADLARFQLMNQRVIPDFQPSPESYAPSVATLERLREVLDRLGVDQPEAVDLYVSLVGGLVDSQLANDPGGDRWRRLLPRAMDMFADHLGLPGPPLRSTQRST
ncbi:DNA-binding transcriptional regulator, AcrR family [Actinokineospora alba]|uniref:DNA-binding transcriptional regulator, AcrR family n=1 Tax=Actinokineospora alba TaxID=504798 RepID=A0A1H0WD49_9PSEU|nr:TetR/AcrR family transcriptional regulator [Actinokineospora alba]TDP68863.1 TetR family transcriptional regulator [Actinokineospora alba]SDI73793.1 DNA-binding transcriptional regulator, AcrR family [Actinokineospora alba]SDP88680.1 DNA-binding transcriptional regulator, AcrR family [Actinokineospora alba]